MFYVARILLKRKGSVLIFALWVIAFLGVFAVQIGLKIRQRIVLVSRLENRSQLRFAAESGIKKAIGVLKLDREKSQMGDSPESKTYRYNNKNSFGNIPVGKGMCQVRYLFFDGASLDPELRYGVVDEESKININVAEKNILKSLIGHAAILDDDRAQELTEAIIDWREFGQSQITSFYSDEYYANLKYPYPPKDSEFELIDELLLVRGFHQDVFEKLIPFITIYGDGRVNINTASENVLMALGLDEAIVQKILFVRRGGDGLEATSDDYIFQKTYDVASELINFVELEASEIKQIDALNAAGKIKTNSSYYLIQSQAELNQRESLTSICVYNINNNRIEYWREKF